MLPLAAVTRRNFSPLSLSLAISVLSFVLNLWPISLVFSFQILDLTFGHHFFPRDCTKEQKSSKLVCPLRSNLVQLYQQANHKTFADVSRSQVIVTLLTLVCVVQTYRRTNDYASTAPAKGLQSARTVDVQWLLTCHRCRVD